MLVILNKISIFVVNKQQNFYANRSKYWGSCGQMDHSFH
jgi:hypothetical protein